MGHYISGIVGSFEVMRDFASAAKLHLPSSLVEELAFLPLSDEHLDTIFPIQGEFDDSMTYLSNSLKSALEEVSFKCPVAYIETEYFGGQGAQSAIVYDRGVCVYGPLTDDDRAISEAMKILGVTIRSGQRDEFEAIGFCRHRNNENWIDESNPQN